MYKVLPSDVARLFLAYLRDRKYVNTMQKFIEECPHLAELRGKEGCPVLLPLAKDIETILEEHAMLTEKVKQDLQHSPDVMWKKLDGMIAKLKYEYMAPSASHHKSSADSEMQKTRSMYAMNNLMAQRARHRKRDRARRRKKEQPELQLANQVAVSAAMTPDPSPNEVTPDDPVEYVSEGPPLLSPPHSTPSTGSISNPSAPTSADSLPPRLQCVSTTPRRKRGTPRKKTSSAEMGPLPSPPSGSRIDPEELAEFPDILEALMSDRDLTERLAGTITKALPPVHSSNSVLGRLGPPEVPSEIDPQTVEEAIDMTSADPAFDSLFSLFNVDREKFRKDEQRRSVKKKRHESSMTVMAPGQHLDATGTSTVTRNLFPERAIGGSSGMGSAADKVEQRRSIKKKRQQSSMIMMAPQHLDAAGNDIVTRNMFPDRAIGSSGGIRLATDKGGTLECANPSEVIEISDDADRNIQPVVNNGGVTSTAEAGDVSSRLAAPADPQGSGDLPEGASDQDSRDSIWSLGSQKSSPSRSPGKRQKGKRRDWSKVKTGTRRSRRLTTKTAPSPSKERVDCPSQGPTTTSLSSTTPPSSVPHRVLTVANAASASSVTLGAAASIAGAVVSTRTSNVAPPESSVKTLVPSIGSPLQNAGSPATSMESPAPNVRYPPPDHRAHVIHLGSPTPSDASRVPNAESPAPSSGSPTPNAKLFAPAPMTNPRSPASNVGLPIPNLRASVTHLRSPVQCVGSSAPNVGSPAPNVGSPVPNVGSPAPNVGSSAPNAGLPPLNVGSPAPTVGSPAPDLGARITNLGSPSLNIRSSTPNIGSPAPSSLGSPVSSLVSPVRSSENTTSILHQALTAANVISAGPSIVRSPAAKSGSPVKNLSSAMQSFRAGSQSNVSGHGMEYSKQLLAIAKCAKDKALPEEYSKRLIASLSSTEGLSPVGLNVSVRTDSPEPLTCSCAAATGTTTTSTPTMSRQVRLIDQNGGVSTATIIQGGVAINPSVSNDQACGESGMVVLKPLPKKQALPKQNRRLTSRKGTQPLILRTSGVPTVFQRFAPIAPRMTSAPQAARKCNTSLNSSQAVFIPTTGYGSLQPMVIQESTLPIATSVAASPNSSQVIMRQAVDGLLSLCGGDQPAQTWIQAAAPVPHQMSGHQILIPGGVLPQTAGIPSTTAISWASHSSASSAPQTFYSQVMAQNHVSHAGHLPGSYGALRNNTVDDSIGQISILSNSIQRTLEANEAALQLTDPSEGVVEPSEHNELNLDHQAVETLMDDELHRSLQDVSTQDIEFIIKAITKTPQKERPALTQHSPLAHAIARKYNLINVPGKDMRAPSLEASPPEPPPVDKCVRKVFTERDSAEGRTDMQPQSAGDGHKDTAEKATKQANGKGKRGSGSKAKKKKSKYVIDSEKQKKLEMRMRTCVKPINKGIGKNISNQETAQGEAITEAGEEVGNHQTDGVTHPERENLETKKSQSCERADDDTRSELSEAVAEIEDSMHSMRDSESGEDNAGGFVGSGRTDGKTAGGIVTKESNESMQRKHGSDGSCLDSGVVESVTGASEEQGASNQTAVSPQPCREITGQHSNEDGGNTDLTSTINLMKIRESPRLKLKRMKLKAGKTQNVNGSDVVINAGSISEKQGEGCETGVIQNASRKKPKSKRKLVDSSHDVPDSPSLMTREENRTRGSASVVEEAPTVDQNEGQAMEETNPLSEDGHVPEAVVNVGTCKTNGKTQDRQDTVAENTSGKSPSTERRIADGDAELVEQSLPSTQPTEEVQTVGQEPSVEKRNDGQQERPMTVKDIPVSGDGDPSETCGDDSCERRERDQDTRTIQCTLRKTPEGETKLVDSGTEHHLDSLSTISRKEVQATRPDLPEPSSEAIDESSIVADECDVRDVGSSKKNGTTQDAVTAKSTPRNTPNGKRKLVNRSLEQEEPCSLMSGKEVDATGPRSPIALSKAIDGTDFVSDRSDVSRHPGPCKRKEAQDSGAAQRTSRKTPNGESKLVGSRPSQRVSLSPSSFTRRGVRSKASLGPVACGPPELGRSRNLASVNKGSIKEKKQSDMVAVENTLRNGPKSMKKPSPSRRTDQRKRLKNLDGEPLSKSTLMSEEVDVQGAEIGKRDQVLVSASSSEEKKIRIQSKRSSRKRKPSRRSLVESNFVHEGPKLTLSTAGKESQIGRQVASDGESSTNVQQLSMEESLCISAECDWPDPDERQGKLGEQDGDEGIFVHTLEPQSGATGKEDYLKTIGLSSESDDVLTKAHDQRQSSGTLSHVSGEGHSSKEQRIRRKVGPESQTASATAESGCSPLDERRLQSCSDRGSKESVAIPGVDLGRDPVVASEHCMPPGSETQKDHEEETSPGLELRVNPMTEADGGEVPRGVLSSEGNQENPSRPNGGHTLTEHEGTKRKIDPSTPDERPAVSEEEAQVSMAEVPTCSAGKDTQDEIINQDMAREGRAKTCTNLVEKPESSQTIAGPVSALDSAQESGIIAKKDGSGEEPRSSCSRISYINFTRRTQWGAKHFDQLTEQPCRCPVSGDRIHITASRMSSRKMCWYQHYCNRMIPLHTVQKLMRGNFSPRAIHRSEAESLDPSDMQLSPFHGSRRSYSGSDKETKLIKSSPGKQIPQNGGRDVIGGISLLSSSEPLSTQRQQKVLKGSNTEATTEGHTSAKTDHLGEEHLIRNATVNGKTCSRESAGEPSTSQELHVIANDSGGSPEAPSKQGTDEKSSDRTPRHADRLGTGKSHSEPENSAADEMLPPRPEKDHSHLPIPTLASSTSCKFRTESHHSSEESSKERTARMETLTTDVSNEKGRNPRPLSAEKLFSNGDGKDVTSKLPADGSINNLTNHQEHDRDAVSIENDACERDGSGKKLVQGNKFNGSAASPGESPNEIHALSGGKEDCNSDRPSGVNGGWLLNSETQREPEESEKLKEPRTKDRSEKTGNQLKVHQEKTVPPQDGLKTTSHEKTVPSQDSLKTTSQEKTVPSQDGQKTTSRRTDEIKSAAEGNEQPSQGDDHHSCGQDKTIPSQDVRGALSSVSVKQRKRRRSGKITASHHQVKRKKQKTAMADIDLNAINLSAFLSKLHGAEKKTST